MLNRLLGCVLIMALLVAAPCNTRAAGVPVIDVSNLVQAILTVQRLVQHYELAQQQLEDFRQNWKAMALNQLLLRAQESRDARLAASAINAVQYLDPDDPRWREQLESVLRVHYALPVTSTEADKFRQVYTGSVETLVTRIHAEQRARAPIFDAHFFQASQEQVAHRRQQALDRLQTRIEGLGEKSQTRQLQAIAAAVVLLGRQQEAGIDALHAKMTQDQHAQLVRLSTVHMVRGAQQDHALRLRGARNPCNGPCLRFW